MGNEFYVECFLKGPAGPVKLAEMASDHDPAAWARLAKTLAAIYHPEDAGKIELRRDGSRPRTLQVSARRSKGSLRTHGGRPVAATCSERRQRRETAAPAQGAGDATTSAERGGSVAGVPRLRRCVIAESVPLTGPRSTEPTTQSALSAAHSTTTPATRAGVLVSVTDTSDSSGHAARGRVRCGRR